MKKFRKLGLAMIVIVVVLTGCQGEESSDENNEEQASRDTQEEQMISIAETFIDQLSEGNYEDATEHFDETMAKELTPEALEEIWVTLQNQVGDFIDKEYKSIGEADGYQIILMTGIFNDADVTFRVTFDENHKIAGFFVQ